VVVEKSERLPNYLKTKKLAEEVKNFSQLVEKSEWSESTVLEHLKLLKENDLTIFEKFRPEEEIFEMVKEAYEDLMAEKKEENFLENGQLKLRPIFEALDEEVDYRDIKLSLLFLD
jgi:DNA-binding transcriptional ArsR family regulator